MSRESIVFRKGKFVEVSPVGQRPQAVDKPVSEARPTVEKLRKVDTPNPLESEADTTVASVEDMRAVIRDAAYKGGYNSDLPRLENTLVTLITDYLATAPLRSEITSRVGFGLIKAALELVEAEEAVQRAERERTARVEALARDVLALASPEEQVDKDFRVVLLTRITGNDDPEPSEILRQTRYLFDRIKNHDYYERLEEEAIAKKLVRPDQSSNPQYSGEHIGSRRAAAKEITDKAHARMRAAVRRYDRYFEEDVAANDAWSDEDNFRRDTFYEIRDIINNPHLDLYHPRTIEEIEKKLDRLKELVPEHEVAIQAVLKQLHNTNAEVFPNDIKRIILQKLLRDITLSDRSPSEIEKTDKHLRSRAAAGLAYAQAADNVKQDKRSKGSDDRLSSTVDLDNLRTAPTQSDQQRLQREKDRRQQKQTRQHERERIDTPDAI